MDLSIDEAYARRICGSLEKSNSKLSPIQGYETLPLVSLDKAVEALGRIVPQLDHMVEIALKNAKKPLDFLSTQESASIGLYTLPWTSEDQSFYYILNATLRSENRENLRPWLLYLKLCTTALAKLPAHSQTIFRGVKKDLVNDFQKGKTFFWWSFVSCTTSLDVLKCEEFLGKEGARTIFAIEAKSGRPIHHHSHVSKENEVLIPPGCQFEVVGILNPADDLHMIQLREIDSQYSSMGFSQIGSHDSSKNRLPSKPSMKPYKIPSYRNATLQQTIEKCRPSGKLDLTLQRLNDQDILMINDEGIVNKKCKEMILRSTGLISESLLILADGIQTTHHLETLDLAENAVKDQGLEYLMPAIIDSTLKILDLSSCEVSDQGVSHIGEMLKKNITLVKLCLNFNQISNSGVNILIDVLNHQNQSLKVLELRGNEDIDDICVPSLVLLITNNQSLKELDLSDCNFSEEGDKKLYVATKSVKRLKIKLSSIL